MRYFNLRSLNKNINKSLISEFNYMDQTEFNRYISRYKLYFDKEVDNILFYKSPNTSIIFVFITENNFLYNTGLMDMSNIRYGSFNAKKFPYSKPFGDLIDSLIRNHVYKNILDSVVAPHLHKIYTSKEH